MTDGAVVFSGVCADLGGPDQQRGQVAGTPLCTCVAWAAVHHSAQGGRRDSADQDLLDGLQGCAATAISTCGGCVWIICKLLHAR
jgi:hypothetical protein